MTGILEDIQLAYEHKRTALFGALWGGFMPFGAYWTVHHDLHSLDSWREYVLVPMVAACLLFSVRTVWQWGFRSSGERIKASCWVIALEGLMIASPTQWLAVVALFYLIGINAVATACVIVRQAKPAPPPTVTDVARAQNLTRREAEKVVARRRLREAPT